MKRLFYYAIVLRSSSEILRYRKYFKVKLSQVLFYDLDLLSKYSKLRSSIISVGFLKYKISINEDYLEVMNNHYLSSKHHLKYWSNRKVIHKEEVKLLLCELLRNSESKQIFLSQVRDLKLFDEYKQLIPVIDEILKESDDFL